MRRLLVILFLSCGTRPALLDAGSDPVDAGDADAGVTLHDGGTTTDAGTVTDAGSVTDAGTTNDLDHDGLDDAEEARLAAAYLPALTLHPMEQCPLGGIIYRARPHPLNPALVYILYDYLFERDCGLGGHVGDNEVFSITVSRGKPKLTAMRAISHQGTACQRISECGTCNGLTDCELTDAGRPRIYPSKDKHGLYALKCSLIATCLDDCAGSEERLGVPLVNVGEPDAHLVENLTTQGFINADAGWTRSEVMNVNPWAPGDFGSAGAVADDLVDAAFQTPACQ